MPADRKDVVVLGAGFSRAVHEKFPLLTDLAREVAPRLDRWADHSTRALVDELATQSGLERAGETTPDSCAAAGTPRPGFDFEAWLSRIAEDQPHLDASENLERRALFARAAIAIREVLVEAEQAAFASNQSLAQWPYELVRVLDVRQATVITMNYDQVIERLAARALWVTGGTGVGDQPPVDRAIVIDDLYDGVPPQWPLREWTRLNDQARPFAMAGRPPIYEVDLRAVTLRLLKLHGSVSWFAAPGDPTGTTLAHWVPTVNGSEDEEQRRRDLPGREPFIVPPSTRKSPYLENPVVRELWRRARGALEGASSLALVGYSLPVTDTTFAGLLSDTVARSDAPIAVVNPCPGPVVEHLVRLGVDRSRIEGNEVDGDGAVATWTHRLLDHQAGEVVRKLRELAEDAGSQQVETVVSVHWGPSDEHRYLGGRQVRSRGSVEGRDLVLELRPDDARDVDPPWPIADLRPLLEQTQRVVVDIAGHRRAIIDHQWSPAPGHGLTNTLVLFPATVPPDCASSPAPSDTQ